MLNIFPVTIAVWSFVHFVIVFLAVYKIPADAQPKSYRKYGHILMLEYLFITVWAASQITY